MSDQVLAAQAHRAYAALRDAIEDGALAAGERVTERQAATLCATSPTPVRDALRRLEREGLLLRRGPRTLVVAEISPRTQRQMGEVEVALRALVARFAAVNAADDEIAELRATLDRADDLAVAITHGPRSARRVEQLLDVLDEFNRGTARACHLPALVDALARARALSPLDRAALIRERALQDPTFGAERYTGHRRLLDAIAARDADAAAEIAREHAATALDDLLPER